MDFVQYVLKNAPRYNLDPQAVIAVARTEGGLVNRADDRGDGGRSFGPHQLYEQGALPKQFVGNPDAADAWAWSPAGFEYALRKMAEAGASGLRGQSAINTIVRKFERPADPDGEVRKATGFYQAAPTRAAAVKKGAAAYPFDPLAGFKYSPLGMPGQGTHSQSEGPANWQSDNAWDYGAPAGTPVYAVSQGTVDPNKYGQLDSSGRFGGYRLTVNSPDNEFYYGHLGDNLAVKPGQQVKPGDLLGYIGNVPGLSPHLHFGVKVMSDGNVSLQPELKPSTPQVGLGSQTANPSIGPETWMAPKPQPLPDIPKPPVLAAPQAPPDFVSQLASSGGAARRFSSLVDDIARSVFK